MKAENKIRVHNHRKATMDGSVCYEHVCAACGIQLEGNPMQSDQRVDGWPTCEPCFLET